MNGVEKNSQEGKSTNGSHRHEDAHVHGIKLERHIVINKCLAKGIQGRATGGNNELRNNKQCKITIMRRRTIGRSSTLDRAKVRISSITGWGIGPRKPVGDGDKERTNGEQ